MTPMPNGGMEYRFVERSGAPKLENGRLSGRAAPFNKVTMIGRKPWGFREKIMPGAFAKSIKDGDVVLLDNHDHARPISRQSAGTLVMNETKGGLDWDAEPADTTYANDVRENAKAGNYGGCSFGFEVIRDSWTYNKDDDVDERVLLEVKLHEISVCTFPAYADGTSVTARDQVGAALEARDTYYEKEYASWVENGVSEDDERDGKAPYGNVTYADPGYLKDGRKRYPIDTKAHAKAAWSYINKQSNASQYSSKQLATIKSKIKAACKKFGVKVSDDQKNAAVIESEDRIDATDQIGATDEIDDENGEETGEEGDEIEVKSSSRVILKGGRKLLARIREVAFDESRGDEPGKQLAKIRQMILHDLVKQATRNAVERAGAERAGNQVGTSADSDGDADDPVCQACNGSGKASDGVSTCAGGCSGTGRVAGQGDIKGTPRPATFDENVNFLGGEKYEAEASGESRDEDGQPDTSTDPEGDDDAARRVRAIARMRRMQSDAEAAARAA
jgi:uncharacterized protein